MSRSIRLAVIPGDGIGQEVVAQGLKVLSAVLPQDVKLETKELQYIYFSALMYRLILHGLVYKTCCTLLGPINL